MHERVKDWWMVEWNSEFKNFEIHSVATVLERNMKARLAGQVLPLRAEAMFEGMLGAKEYVRGEKMEMQLKGEVG